MAAPNTKKMHAMVLDGARCSMRPHPLTFDHTILVDRLPLDHISHIFTPHGGSHEEQKKSRLGDFVGSIFSDRPLLGLSDLPESSCLEALRAWWRETLSNPKSPEENRRVSGRVSQYLYTLGR